MQAGSSIKGRRKGYEAPPAYPFMDERQCHHPAPDPSLRTIARSSSMRYTWLGSAGCQFAGRPPDPIKQSTLDAEGCAAFNDAVQRDLAAACDSGSMRCSSPAGSGRTDAMCGLKGRSAKPPAARHNDHGQARATLEEKKLADGPSCSKIFMCPDRGGRVVTESVFRPATRRVQESANANCPGSRRPRGRPAMSLGRRTSTSGRSDRSRPGSVEESSITSPSGRAPRFAVSGLRSVAAECRLSEWTRRNPGSASARPPENLRGVPMKWRAVFAFKLHALAGRGALYATLHPEGQRDVTGFGAHDIQPRTTRRALYPVQRHCGQEFTRSRCGPTGAAVEKREIDDIPRWRTRRTKALSGAFARARRSRSLPSGEMLDPNN